MNERPKCLIGKMWGNIVKENIVKGLIDKLLRMNVPAKVQQLHSERLSLLEFMLNACLKATLYRNDILQSSVQD